MGRTMNAKNFQYVLDVNLACLVGIDEAILLRNIAYWCFKNKANERNFKNGRYWTYNTLKAYAEEFPFWSVQNIRTILNRLIHKGWLLKGSFNKDNLNHTCWYALSDSAICYIPRYGVRILTICFISTKRFVRINKSKERRRVNGKRGFSDLLESTHRFVRTNKSIC